MQLPDHLTVEERYARFSLPGPVSLGEAVALISGAIEFCREHNVSRLLLDITQLIGVRVPTVVDRFWYVREWAEKARGMVIVAVAAPPELIDARKFGVTAAHNLGLRLEVFTTAAPALDWLLRQKTE